MALIKVVHDSSRLLAKTNRERHQRTKSHQYGKHATATKKKTIQKVTNQYKSKRNLYSCCDNHIVRYDGEICYIWYG